MYSLQKNASVSGTISGRDVKLEMNGLKSHMIFENEQRKRLACYLCKLANPEMRSKWTTSGCADCKNGLHVNCYNFFHRRTEMEEKEISMVQYSVYKLTSTTKSVGKGK